MRAPAGPTGVGALLVLTVVGVALLLVPDDPLSGRVPPADVLAGFTPEQRAREEAFHRALRPPAYGSLAGGVLVAGALGLTRAGARLVRAVARPLGGGWAWQVLLGTLALGAVARLAVLPLDLRREQVLRAYGLSTQTWSGWAADQGKAALVSGLLTAGALLAAVALARRRPRTWWRPAAGGAAALVLAGSFAYPVVVEPLFADFRSLEAGPLRDDLLALARADGVPVQDVLVSDASRRTTAVNAYVSGFGSTRRVVLYDTLVRSAAPEEVRLVVAHELGHAEERDVLVGTLLGALGAAAGVCLLAGLLRRPGLLARAGADGPGDPRVVPLVLALAAVGGLLVTPAANLYSRRVEARADLHSLRLTGDPTTFAAVERRLAVTNLSDLDPPPLLVALFATHPPVRDRLALAREFAEGRA